MMHGKYTVSRITYVILLVLLISLTQACGGAENSSETDNNTNNSISPDDGTSDTPTSDGTSDTPTSESDTPTSDTPTSDTPTSDGTSDTPTSDGTSNTGPITITNTTPSTYVWTKLLAGEKVYIDRAYTYPSNLGTYEGLNVVQTANDDKTSTGDSFFSFDIDKAATIYLGYARDNSLPTWLDTWTPTNDTIKTSDRVMYLFKKDFPAGTVTLGGNEGAQSMYFVIVEDGTTTDNPTKTPDVATLSWTPPQKNEDGTDVVDLAGYIIYYGTQSGNYTNTITINDPTATNYRIDNLSPNTYYFAISAIDYSGNESALTTEQSVTIDPT